MRNGRGDSTVRILFNGVLAIVVLTLFLSACFKLGGEPSIDAEFTLTREISLMGISEFAFSVDVTGVKDAAVVEFDNGMPSVTLSGGKAESRFFANAGAGEVTLLVRDSRGVELLKKTVILPETKSTFDVAAVEDRTGIYVLIDNDLIFYSLECLENMTFAEKVELLIGVLSVNDSYVIIDTPPFGAWIWDFETYPANPKYDLTQDTLHTLGLPNNAIGFCEASLFNVLNGRFLYGLGVIIEGNGLAVVAPEETIYEEGTEVSLTAEPAEGWLFEKWTGDATGSDTQIVITMDGNKTITASFKLERYSVAFFVSDSEGSVEGALVSFAGEERETDAQGNAEFYELSPGSKDYSITKLGYEDLAGNVIVDSDKTVDIVLAYKTYVLTTLVSGVGSISRSIEKERYSHGEIIELAAIPASGWNFGGWTGDLEGSLNPTHIAMDGDKTVTAHFVEHQCFVEAYASPENGGAVSGGGAYGYGDEAILTAEASECYMFSGWYEDGQLVSEDREYRFNVFDDRVIEASFVASVLSKDFKFILENAFLGCKYEVRLELDPAITKVRFIYPDIDPEIQTPIPEEAIPDENGIVDLSAFWTSRDAQAVMIVCYAGDEVVSQCEAVLSKETLAEFEITFDVSDDSVPLQGASVNVDGESRQTDSQGRAVFPVVAAGNRSYTVSKAGYENVTGSVDVDGDKSVNISLAKKTYTLSTNTVGQGSVSKSPDKSTYTHGEIVQLTAIPSTGWSFSSWSGDQDGSVNPASITMNSNKTITANFLINQYSIAVSSSPSAGGTASGGGVYNHGQTVNLVASATMGYEFVNWTENGVQVSANTTYSFTATGNRTLVANFRLKIYTITATAGAGGSITPSGNVNVTHGSNQAFAITPNTGYDIEDVKVDGVSIGAVTNYTFNNVVSNHTIEVSFKLKAYAISATANPSAGGTASGGGVYNHGQTVNLIASANTGYEFVNWTENGVQVSANTTCSFTATGNRTLVVNFRLKTYTITATAGTGGSITPSENVNVTHGSNQTFSIAADSGYEISDVKVDNVSVGKVSSYTFNNVIANHSIQASFSLLPPATYTVTFNVNDVSGPLQGANVSFNGESLQTDSQGRAVFSEVPVGNRAYTVSKTGYENSTGSVNVDSDKSVNVFLTKKTYTLSTNTVGQGSVSKSPDKSTYTHGEIVQLTAIPSTGWSFSSWSGDQDGSVNPASITMNSNKTITANFLINQYSIAVSSSPSAGGTASGGGVYNHGQTVNLVASANMGYEFVNWTENGAQVSTSPTYSFTATGNRTLVANFSTQQETGGFKVANSWGIGGWEKVPDGFLFITYEAMKKNGVMCFITDPRDNYEPRAIAVFKISHSVRDDCDIYVGVGNPASPSREKKFDDYYYRGGPLPFPDNKIVLDISEFLPFNNETIYLRVLDRLKTTTTGTIDFFSVEIYSNYASEIPSAVYTSSQTPKNTVNGSSVNVQIPNITVLSGPPFQLETFGAGISSDLLERMKEQMGIYEEGRDYNEVINGYGTGLRPPSLEEWEEIRESWYEIIPFSPQDTLPASVDHSSSIHFPPIGNQGNKGSCVAFSIGYYISTFYEARDRQWDLSLADWVGGYYGAPSTNYQDRIFSPDFIYHQINRGIDGGSAYQDALKVISNVGVSTWKEMPYNTSSCTSWPSEAAWREAPRYRSYSNVMAVMQVTSDQHIQTLKSYLDSGYLVAISIDANKYSKLTQNDVWNSTNYTNPNTNHANTIVGYDDNMSSQ